MYKDLLTQITKYLKPKEEYYILLEIFIPEPYVDDTVFCHFYLIYSLNGIIRQKCRLNSFPVTDLDDGSKIIDEIIIEDNRIIHFGNKILLFDKEAAFICINNKKELKIYCTSVDLKFNSNLKKEIGDIIFRSEKMYEDCYHGGPDTYKINKRSIKSIDEGIKVFKEISKKLPVEIDYDNLSNEAKKYVKII